VNDPVLHLTNHSTRDVFIARDPNWDDQVLLLDGQRLRSARRLRPDESATLSLPMPPGGRASEEMMGVIFADGPNYNYGSAGAYQMSIGQQPETSLLAVTDEYRIKRPAIEYLATRQQAWSMDIEFVDACLINANPNANPDANPDANPHAPRRLTY
jgi:hypothetical protein